MRVALSTGEQLRVDSVVCAAGLRPRLGLARSLATNRGIVVDAYLRTSQPHVYALGDCAEIDGQVLPYLQPITLSAQALARTLVGDPTPVSFGPMPVAVKTPRFPIQLGGMTEVHELRWEVREDDLGLSARAMLDKRLVGYVAAGAHNGFGLLRELMQAV